MLKIINNFAIDLDEVAAVFPVKKGGKCGLLVFKSGRADDISGATADAIFEAIGLMDSTNPAWRRTPSKGRQVSRLAGAGA